MTDQAQGAARFILTVFRDKGRQVGESMSKTQMFGEFGRARVATGLINDAFDIAVSEGWLETTNGFTYQLTREGQAYSVRL